MTLTVNRVFRLLLFVLIPNLFTTPLRIFVEAVIEGKEGAPAFVTVPFIIYDVGVDANNFFPVSVKQVIDFFGEQVYIDDHDIV